MLAATLTSVVALTSANAADIFTGPASGGYKDGPAYAEVNWSGFYVGANIGGAWGNDAITDVLGDWSPVIGTANYGFNNSASGVFGGAQLGYNFQRGHFVFGPEVDIGGMDLSHSVWEAGNVGLASSSLGSGFYADVAGRLGYTVDRALVYAKGGYAYYGGSVTQFDALADTVKTASTSGVSGWTVGAGVEYKINPSLSLKAEYMHFDFGSVTNNVYYNADPCGTAQCPYKNALTVDTAKVGVNYFVNSVPALLK